MRDNNEGGAPTGGPVRDPAAAGAAGTSSSSQDLRSATAQDGDASTPRPVPADMQQFIGRQLRAVFDDVAKQPVPDRFLELMKQLDSKTGAR